MAGVEFDGVATREVFDNTSAGLRMGVPNPYGTPLPSGPKPMSAGQYQQALQDVWSTGAPEPAQAQPRNVGYNPATGQLWSNGRVYDGNDVTSLLKAQAAGDLGGSQQPIPQEYNLADPGQFEAVIKNTPDWQKEAKASVRNYGAGFAAIGAAMGSDAAKEKYLQLSGEADLLSRSSSAPKDFDEVKFGENALAHVRRLGIDSVPYLAELAVAYLTVGTIPAAKTAGTAAAKHFAEKAIVNEANRLIATTAGRITQEQALSQAATSVGKRIAGSTGMAAASYPSSLGDILTNQYDQAGQFDLGSAAAYAVPYAGLNLIGLGGLMTGVNKMVGATAIKDRAVRGAAAFGLTTGGEALNETGQEVTNQLGRMAVDPNASLTSPDALHRYKESAIGGAILGGIGGGLHGAHAAITPVDMTPTELTQKARERLAGWQKEDTDKYLGDFMGRVNAAPQDTLPGVSPITSLYQNAFPSGTNLNLFGFQPEAPGPVFDENLPPLNPTQVPADFITQMRQYDLTLPMPATEAEQKQRQATAEALGQQVAAQGFGTVQNEPQPTAPDFDVTHAATAALDAPENQSIRAAWTSAHRRDDGSRITHDFFEQWHDGGGVTPDVGSQYDSHGIAKGNPLGALLNILSNGINRSRRFDTAPLVQSAGNEAGAGAGLGTAGGAYKDGPFILLGARGKELSHGIHTVLVADGVANVIPQLQAKFPAIRFVKYSEAQSTLSSDSSAAQVAAPDIPAPIRGIMPRPEEVPALQQKADALGQQVKTEGFGTVQQAAQGELPLEQNRNKAGWRGSARIAFSEAGGTGKKIEQALSLGSPEQAAQKLRYLAEVAKSTKQAEAFDAAHKSLLGVSIEEFSTTNRLQNVREQLLGALLPKQKDELARILGIGQYEKQPSDVTIAATAGVTNSAVGKWYDSIADRLKPVVERLGITRKEAEQALGIDRTVTTDATEEQLAELTNSGSISEDGEAAEVAQNQLHTNATLGVKQGTAVGKAMYKRVAGENGRAWDELSTLEQTHAADAARSVKENAQGVEGEGTGVVASPSMRKAHARAQGVAAIEAIAQNPVGELKPEPPTPIKDANALTDFVETNQDLMENPENTLLERVAEKLSHVKVPDRMDIGTELDLSIEEWDAVGVPGDPAWNELTIDEQVAWVTNFVRWKLDQAALEPHQFKANLVENRDGQERSKPAAQEGAGKAAARKAPPAKGVQGEAAGSEKEKPGEYAVAAPLVRPEREAGPVTVTKGKKAQKLVRKKKVQYREGEAAQYATDAVAMRNLLLKLFFSPEKFDSLVKIVQSARDLKPAEYALLRGADPDSISGISTGGRIILIADNIVEGQELAVFLHEVGVHLGMEKLLGKANMEKLAAQVEAWAKAGTGLEGRIATEAVRRAEKTTSDNKREELIAYFIDEAVKAGVNPTALKNQSNALTQWFRTLWAAAKVALRKIGLGRFEQLTAQNLVDLAFGSAKLELTGTWHGTAAKFRNFNHNYMGSGEGAQAFGWGTYLAQRVGIAKEYWKADVERKRTYRAAKDESEIGLPLENFIVRPDGSLMRVDVAVHDDEMLDWDKPLSEQSEVVRSVISMPKEKGFLKKLVVGSYNTDNQATLPNGVIVDKDATGEQMYNALEKALGSDKAASEYLDSIGIKGIKFLDSPSRDPQPPSLSDVGLDQLAGEVVTSGGNTRVIPKNAKLRTRRGAIYVQLEGVVHKNTRDYALLDSLARGDKSLDDIAFPDEQSKLDGVFKIAQFKGDQTHNLVIFNDKNIQRVSTQVGARRDSDAINYAEVTTADEFVPKDTVKGRFTNILGHLRRAGVSLRELAQIKREFGSDLTRTKDGKEEGLGPLEELIRLSGSYSKEVLDMARGTIDKVVALDETARNKLSHLLNQASLNGFVLSEPDTSARNGWMLSDLKDAEGEALDEAKAVHDRFKALRAEYNAAGKEVSDLYSAVDALTEKLLQLEFGTRTKFIIDSYLTELKAKVDGKTKAEIEKISFDDLTPATFTAQRNKLKALFKGNAEAEKAIRDMSAEVHTRMEGFHQRRGTYVPLMRFGDWVVVARSNDFIEQQKVVDASKAEMDALKRKSPEMVEYMKLADAAAEARASAHKRGSKVSYEAAAEARKAMKEFRNTKEFKDFKEELGKVAREYKKEYRTLVRMAKDSKHFNVHKEEREDFAKQRADNYVANGFSKENVYHKPADTWIGGIDSVSTSFANKLIDRINRSYEGDSDHDKAMRKRNEQAVKRIFVETQHENSSLHRLAMRRSISGYNKDISRVLQSFMLQSAHRLSAQKFFIPIQEQLDAVREIASDKDKAGSTKLTEVANELAIRRHMDLSYEETPIQDAVTRFNQAWVLGASPAYLMQQFGQTFMLTVPHLSGRNSVGAATKAMWKGARDAVSLIRESGKGSGLMNRFEIKLDSKLLTEDEQKALKYVADLGQLDILMDHDISLGARGKETSKYDRMIEMTNWTARQLETTNRISTALAAYRLETERLKKEGRMTAEQIHDEAKKYAAESVEQTQVDYSNENAARWMKRNAFAGSKLIMQFKKYQVHMIQMLLWNSKKALAGDKEAQRILTGILTTHMLMAGSLGLPIAAPIFAVAQMAAWLGADDDEVDPEVAYKNFLADMIGKDAADAFVRGLPAALGADMSKRLGLGNVFSPVPFVRSDKQGKEQFDAMVLAYLGPSMSTGGRLVDGMSALTDGKFVDAWSKMLPKYIADPLKAYKAAQEGITTKQGNVRIPADNLSVADVIMIGMGVPSLKVNKYYEYNTAFEDQKAAATRVASELKKQWAKGDDRPGTREAIDEFNERHPSMRITPKDLFAAQKETVRYAKGVTEDGLKVGKRDKEFAENLRF